MPQIVLERPRLLRHLIAALRDGHVLISAPAGYGKSTLLRRLVSEYPRSTYIPLGPADVDLPYLQNHIAPLLQDYSALVLDDVHHLAGSDQALRWLLEQLGRPSPRLVVSGRHMPFDLDALPPGRVQRLTGADMAFTPAETAAMLTSAAQRSPDAVAAWHSRSGGWPLAIGLLASQEWQSDPVDLSGSALFSYLAGNLLTGLPDDVRRFMELTGLALSFDDGLAAELLAADGLAADAVRLRNEVQRRNLFLEPARTPGWRRYHQLIGQFLRQRPFPDSHFFAELIVTWFETHDNLELAIEQALASGLEARAAVLISRASPEQIRKDGRYLTYRRWITSLSEPTHQLYPALRLQLGAFLHNLQPYRAEAWRYVEATAQLAANRNDEALARTVRLRTGFMRYREGDYDRALATAWSLLADSECRGHDRSLALRLASVCLSETGRLREARAVFSQAVELAAALGDEDELHFTRNNLALTVLIPLGELEEAARLLQAEIDHFAESPALRLRSLVAWCDLCTAGGDWIGLAAAIEEWEQLQTHIEAAESGDQMWLNFYQALLATTDRNRLPQARRFAAEMRALAGDRPLAVLSLVWLECRLLRAEGRWSESAARSAAFLEAPGQPLFWRSSLALDRDIAAALDDSQPAAAFRLHRETHHLIQWRARADLMRLRAVLTIVCWKGQDRRWRHHARAVLAQLARPGYPAILTGRDPDLGAAFWSTLLAENVEPARAMDALQTIGDITAVSPLLRHPRPQVRARAARTLAAIGREEAMPVLAAAQTNEHEVAVSRALELALTHLEHQPPPLLSVKLMGEFALLRDGQPVEPRAWYRPIVRRLFQYFALHRGQPLSKDRILEDLWPGSTPDHGWTAFRTAYSRLRQTLDPFMRAKGPARYFDVSGEVYRFDPAGRVTVDSEIFQATMRAALHALGADEARPASPELLAALEGWEQLLPDLPYEDWLLEPRERLQSYYVEGCLAVAVNYFGRGQPADAMSWARRVVETAPWIEQAYQLLMRAYARQGQRSLALATFRQAKAALEAELAVAPSPLTIWLAERLQRGEEI